MAVEVFKLFGSIFVNNDEANKSIAKTNEKASSVASTLGNGIKTAAKWGAAIVGGASAAAGGMMKMAQSSASTADHIDKMSQKIGLSRQAYQELDFICSQTGTSVDSLRGGMKTLTNQMDAASGGTQSAVDLFKRLGVEIDDGNGKMKSQEQMLYDCLTALQGVNNQTERAALANKLFGKSGTELMPLLNSQSGSIDEMKQKAHELGLVMSDELIDSGVGLTDSLDQTKRGFRAVITTLGGSFMPIVKKVSDHLQGALPYIQKGIKQLEPIVSQFLESMLPALLEMGQTIFPILLTALQILFPILGDFTSTVLPVLLEILSQSAPFLAQFVQEFLPALLEIIQVLLPIVGQIVLQLLPVLFQIMQQLLPAFMQIVQMILPPLLQAIQLILPMITQIVSQVLPLVLQFVQLILPFVMQIVSAVLPILINLLTQLLPPVLQIVDSVLPLFLQLFESILPLISLLTDTLLPGLLGLFDLMAPAVELLANLFGDGLTTTVQALTTALTPFTDILSNLITFITDVFQGKWEDAWNAIVETFKQIFNLIPLAVETLINAGIGMINGIIDGVNAISGLVGITIDHIPDVQLPRLRQGIDYVPSDKFPALLDAGEAVLTASEAEEYRKAKREAGTASPFVKSRDETIINQTFNVSVNVDRISDSLDINDLATKISQLLAEEVRKTEGVYA